MARYCGGDDNGLLFVAADFLERAATRLDAECQHDQRRNREAGGAESEHADITDGADDVADDDRPGDGSDAAAGRGKARAGRTCAGRVKLGRIGVETRPHAEHEELHGKAVDKQHRRGAGLAVDECQDCAQE